MQIFKEERQMPIYTKCSLARKTYMEWILIIVIIVVVIVLLTSKKGPSQKGYRLNSPLFSKAERSFYGVLLTAVSQEHVLMGKVRVADVLLPEKGLNKSQWQTAFNKVALKHFDFILCEKDTLNVLAAIELDDKSHGSQKAKARDNFLNDACASAGFTIIRFSAKKTYQIAEIKEQIVTALARSNTDIK